MSVFARDPGGNEAVAPLGKLLADEKLCGPAARALIAIGTPDAASARRSVWWPALVPVVVVVAGVLQYVRA